MVRSTRLRITVGPHVFGATLEDGRAPRSCDAILALLPMRRLIIHARWSGEAAWIPFGSEHVAVPWEDPTSHPAPGELLLYPGGLSEMEILVPYGAVTFASKAGQLAGNHFATIDEGLDQLRALGQLVLYRGAQDIVIERA